MIRNAQLLPITAAICLTFVATLLASHPPADGNAKPANKLDSAAIRKLVEQLKSGDFRTREKATKELAALDEVPDLLREAAKSSDAEVRGRAIALVDQITANREARAFKAMAAELQVVDFDRFIAKIVTDKKSQGDKQWEFLRLVAKALTKRANDLAGRTYEVPEFDVKAMQPHEPTRRFTSRERVLLHNAKDRAVSWLDDSLLLSAGPTPRIPSIRRTLVIVDGDLDGVNFLDNCLVIVRGDVRGINLNESIILATGEFRADPDARAENCFFQVRSMQGGLNATNCHIVAAGPNQRGPLQMLKFSDNKLNADDAKIVWGKEVNGLAVSIAPAKEEGKFVVRWKNVGKETLEVQWVRFDSDKVYKGLDDLQHHVHLKNADGKLAPARTYKFPEIGGPPYRPRTVILEPDKVHTETIDLWKYVDKPAADGRYQLSIDMEVKSGYAPSQKGAKYWTGKIESNAIGVKLGK